MKTTSLLAFLSLVLCGCAEEGTDAEECERGTEGCACLSSGGCDNGLSCLSDLCVDESGDDDQSAEDDDSGDDDQSAEDDDPAEPEPVSEPEPADDTAEPEPEPTDDTSEPEPVSEPKPVSEPEPEPVSEPTAEPEPNTPMQSELSDGSLGSSCGQCEGYLECDMSAPGGYCTSLCEGTQDCPGGDCYTVGGGAVCLLSCASDADCRSGYSCGGLSASPVCVPGEAMPLGCGNACVHYLTCKGEYTEDGLDACTTACDEAGFTEEQVEAYLSLGCSEAVEQASGESSEDSGGGADCDGCVWDGSECTYYSDQYGSASAGFSWAAISCDSSCCG